jgi:hypothetical protein
MTYAYGPRDLRHLGMVKRICKPLATHVANPVNP